MVDDGNGRWMFHLHFSPKCCSVRCVQNRNKTHQWWLMWISHFSFCIMPPIGRAIPLINNLSFREGSIEEIPKMNSISKTPSSERLCIDINPRWFKWSLSPLLPYCSTLETPTDVCSAPSVHTVTSWLHSQTSGWHHHHCQNQGAE